MNNFIVFISVNILAGKKELRCMVHINEDSYVNWIEQLCLSTWESVYRLIYFKVQNREEAEDITQETYVRAIPYLQKNRVPPDKQMAFLKTVALNIIRDRWRQHQRRGTTADLEAIAPKEVASEDPAEWSVQRIAIEKALNQLSKEQRTVIELRIIKGYSVAETARIMNKKETTIRVMQHRALQALNRILHDETK
ncbi:RNA polymerase sigma factor [Geobacillus thermodenitrificans subsp. calidus]